MIDERFTSYAYSATIAKYACVLGVVKKVFNFLRPSHEVGVRLESGWDLLTSPIRRSIMSSNNTPASPGTQLN